MVPRDATEIIEIGCVLDRARDLMPIAEYQGFVRPVRFPAFTDFCRSLTGVTHAEVDAAPTFPMAFEALLDWIGDHAGPVFRVQFASWGEFDRRPSSPGHTAASPRGLGCGRFSPGWG